MHITSQSQNPFRLGIDYPPQVLARALVVDDEPIVQRLVARILEREGADVTSASDTEEALAAVGSGLFDAAFVDVGIPPDGCKPVVDALIDLTPAPRIVLISGRPLDETQQAYLDSVGGAFVAKPFGPGALLDAAKRARPPG